MKKGLVLTAVLLLAFATVLVGCSSAPKVYDSSVPLEESSTIRIETMNGIKSFDGKKVGWHASMFSQKLVVIPAGKHTFRLNSKITRAGTEYYGEVDMTCDLLPGHTYYIHGYLNGNSLSGRIMDEEIMSRELVPNPESPDASPFEGKWANPKDNTDTYIFVGNEYIRSFKLFGEQYILRGNFNFNEKSLWTLTYAAYNSKKGIFVPAGGNAFVTYSFDGTTLKYGVDQYRKVE